MFDDNKKEYVSPQISVEYFLTEDILDTPAPLALSGFGKDDDDGYIPGWY